MNAEKLIELYDRVAEAPDAIPRLRRFLLDLAVRGKLVEQDERDEPVSGQASDLESDDLTLDEIPSTWAWHRLASITELITDGEHATPKRIPEAEVPLVTAKNVRDGFMDYSVTDWVSRETASKAWKRCKPEVGDVLLVCVGATIGRLTVLEAAKDMVLVRSVALIRPSSKMNVMYLALALRSPFCQKQMWSKVREAAQPCLYLNRINSLQIPLPPLAEQGRIVAKVDALMGLCDRLEAALVEGEAVGGRLLEAVLGGGEVKAGVVYPEADVELGLAAEP